MAKKRNVTKTMGRPSLSEGEFASNRIKQERDRAGLSQEELAAKTGMSTSLISRLETSKRRAKLDQIDAIAAVLGIPRSALVEISEDARTIQVTTTIGDTPENAFVDFEVKVPNFHKNATLFAALVVGDAANRCYPNGSVVVWRPLDETGEPPIPGRRYVIESTVGGKRALSIKTFLRDRTGGEKFVHESDDLNHQQILNAGEAGVEVLGRIVMAITIE